MKRHYGYLPDSLDARDQLFAKVAKPTAAPPTLDLIAKMPPVVDQGQLGSCTGNGVAACVDFLHPTNMPSSRLQIYYDERVIEHTVNQDSGAQIRDGIKVVHKTGAALESLWPYNTTRYRIKPSAKAMASAKTRKVSSYLKLINTNDMVNCIVAGFPFVFGFSVPSDFESEAMAKTGVMTWDKTQQTVGGHCVVGVGYDLPNQQFICRNSWGTDWGMPANPGHFLMPFIYMGDANCASDFWTCRK